MKNIQQAINTIKYEYNPDEFFPIMSGRELVNKGDFFRYKMRCLLVKRTLI